MLSILLVIGRGGGEGGGGGEERGLSFSRVVRVVIGQGAQHQTCTFEICYFHFDYGSNLTSSGILVMSMPNV